MVNGYHNKVLDVFFTYYTWLGDGTLAVVVIVAALLFKKRALAGKLLITFLLSGIVSQILKSYFHAPRPKSFFLHQAYPYFIEGVTHTGFHSFPSGHTTTAFAVACILACNTHKKYWTVLLCLLAAGVAYSRVYLGQHFVEDVLAGMLLGLFTAIIIEYLYSNIKIPTLKRYQPVIQHEQPVIEL